MKLSDPLKNLSMRSAHLVEFKPKEWYVILTDHRDTVESGLERWTERWPTPHAVHGPLPSLDLAQDYRLDYAPRMDLVSTTPHGPFIRKDGEAQATYAAYIALATPVPDEIIERLRQAREALAQTTETLSPREFDSMRRRRRGP